ncbi:hypothetical protein FISHEDRAFT_16689, partial [Fistulina hepatica ATCC 64428]
LHDYQETIEEEFDFQAGDSIVVTAPPEDGWWSGELLDEEGRPHERQVFFSNFVSLLSCERWATWSLHDYQETIEEEFDFQAGDSIVVTAPPEDGWWSGELLDEEGRPHERQVFFSNFV